MARDHSRNLISLWLSLATLLTLLGSNHPALPVVRHIRDPSRPSSCSSVQFHIILASATSFQIKHKQHTLPGLHHDFCTLWNTLGRNARDSGDLSPSVGILKATRYLHLASHQGTDTPLTASSASTWAIGDTLNQSWTYSFCNNRDHRPKRRRVLVVSVGDFLPR